MQERNWIYLLGLLKEMEFEGPVSRELERGLRSGSSQFQLIYETRMVNTDILSVLHFKRSPSSDLYYFNRYELFFRPDHLPYEVLQVFFVVRDQIISLREAFNLLNGRAVWKARPQAEARSSWYWLKLDFHQLDGYGNYRYRYFHPRYGFDLEQVLSRFAIREWDDPPQRERMIASLRKGNQVRVHFFHEGQDRTYWIEANPQFKTLNIYDEERRRLYSRDFHRLERRQVDGSGVDPSVESEALVAESPLPLNEEAGDEEEEESLWQDEEK